MIENINEADNIFNIRLNRIDYTLLEATTLFSESIDDDGFVMMERKKEKVSFLVAIKRFFAELIESFYHFIDSIKVEVDKKLRKTDYEHRLRAMHKELRDGKYQNITEIEVYDIWTMKARYVEAVKQLTKISKRISSMKYKYSSQMEDDIKEFNKILETNKAKLEEAAEMKVKVPIQKMIDFIEDEVNGRGSVINTLNEAVSTLQQMQKDCDLLEKKLDIYGADIVAKQSGYMRKAAMSTSRFCEKWGTKIISNIIILIVS